MISTKIGDTGAFIVFFVIKGSWNSNKNTPCPGLWGLEIWKEDWGERGWYMNVWEAWEPGAVRGGWISMQSVGMSTHWRVAVSQEGEELSFSTEKDRGTTSISSRAILQRISAPLFTQKVPLNGSLGSCLSRVISSWTSSWWNDVVRPSSGGGERMHC